MSNLIIFSLHIIKFHESVIRIWYHICVNDSFNPVKSKSSSWHQSQLFPAALLLLNLCWNGFPNILAFFGRLQIKKNKTRLLIHSHSVQWQLNPLLLPSVRSLSPTPRSRAFGFSWYQLASEISSAVNISRLRAVCWRHVVWYYGFEVCVLWALPHAQYRAANMLFALHIYEFKVLHN